MTNPYPPARPPEVIVTDAEMAEAVAASIEQSAGPLLALAEAYRRQFAVWAGRRPGAVAGDGERLAATQALARLDELVAETTIVRVRLIREIRANDARVMAQLSHGRELALAEAERDRRERAGAALVAAEPSEDAGGQG